MPDDNSFSVRSALLVVTITFIGFTTNSALHWADGIAVAERRKTTPSPSRIERFNKPCPATKGGEAED